MMRINKDFDQHLRNHELILHAEESLRQHKTEAPVSNEFTRVLLHQKPLNEQMCLMSTTQMPPAMKIVSDRTPAGHNHTAEYAETHVYDASLYADISAPNRTRQKRERKKAAEIEKSAEADESADTATPNGIPPNVPQSPNAASSATAPTQPSFPIRLARDSWIDSSPNPPSFMNASEYIRTLTGERNEQAYVIVHGLDWLNNFFYESAFQDAIRYPRYDFILQLTCSKENNPRDDRYKTRFEVVAISNKNGNLLPRVSPLTSTVIRWRDLLQLQTEVAETLIDTMKKKNWRIPTTVHYRRHTPKQPEFIRKTCYAANIFDGSTSKNKVLSLTQEQKDNMQQLHFLSPYSDNSELPGEGKNQMFRCNVQQTQLTKF